MNFTRRIRNAAAGLFRGYDAAGTSGRWPIAAQMQTPLASAIQARPTVAARAAYLASNSPYVAAIATNSVTAFVGDGPSLQHDDDDLVARWNDWWSDADAEGVSTLGGLVARVCRSWLVAGEAFLLMRSDVERALRLLLIAPEQVDASRNETLPGGGFILSGIETNGDGRHVAVWVNPFPPDHPQGATAATDAIRVAIEDCIHLYEAPTPGAVRGVSPLSSILARAVEIDLTEDSLIKQAQVAALLSTYITDPSGTITLDAKNGQVSLEPGTVRILPSDSMITTVSPPSNDNGVEFQRAMIRSLAAGAGVPFELVSADLSQTSFSSARFGDRHFRRRTQAVQRLLLEPMMDRIFYRFLALETLAGRLSLDLDNVAAPRWLWAGYEPIDPLKDTKADVEALRAGFASRSEIIARRSGRDVADVDRELASDTRPMPAAPVGDISMEADNVK
jgi:lambda family phage portal protein